MAALLPRSLNETPRQFSSAFVDRGSENAKLVRKLRQFRRDIIEEIRLEK
jgi:hypothetical protein